MRFRLTQSFSRWPSVGRIFLLAALLFSCFITGVGSVTAQTTDDHGNSLSDATNLPLGSSITGRIDPGDDLDVFRLDLSSASGNTHVWLYTTGNLDSLGELYDSSGDLLVFDDDTTSGGVIVETNFRIPRTLAPGVYYVGVSSADLTTTGDYTLHARADDHGGFLGTATTLALGSSVAGSIDPGFDRDVFKLDLSGASGTTDVWIYTTGDLDTQGWLYDSSGGLLVFNGDSYIVGREDGFHIRRNLSSGVYYLSVRSRDGAIGDYTLHAEAVTDPGASRRTAAALNLDAPTPGMIDTANDADYFRLVLTESKNLIIYTKGLNLSDADGFLPISPLDGGVFDNNGTEISVNVYDENIGGYRWGFRIEDDFDTDTYYIKVTAPVSDAAYPVPYTIHAYEDAEYTDFIEGCEAATAALNNPQISDPLYGCQWHLRNQEQGGEGINVEAVWTEGLKGEGVNIAVVDDGLYSAHEDLATNINTVLNHNYNTGVTDSTDIYHRYEHHGTAVAGVIAARDNGVGVRGVAPRATVYGYNWLAGDWQQFEDINRADAMARNRVVTAVSNNSWGPPDGPGLGDANQLWEFAIDSGTRQGYDGKGVFYVFAGGNGGESHLENPDGTPVGGHIHDFRGGDNSNLDELANHYAVTAVCAVNDQDTRSDYSEKGANLWVCAPSNDLREGYSGVVTTENSDRYRSNFGGTSAAAPIVSGVAALLRDANPDLTWRDLKLILAASARKNDAANPGWAEGARKYGADSDADRYHFNHEYGFGVVDAKAAVDLARGWTNVPALESASAASQAAVTIPPPSGSVPQTVTTTLALNTGIRFTEFVEINTDFDHTSFRDMEIELESPSGAVSKLAVPFDTRHYHTDGICTYGITVRGETRCIFFVPLDGEFRFGSARHLGEDPNGVWTLRLTDHFPALGGTLRSWSIRVYGHMSRPGAPTITTPITAGADSLTVAWSAPSDSGGPAITAYDLRYIQTSADETMDANWTVLEDVWATGSGPLTYTITGLAGATQYDVQVRGGSSVGKGAWSTAATGTPARATTGPCTTGVAVPGAASNPGLVADCEALLAAGNTLAGSGTLNWSAGTTIASWDGVTLSGSPLRVTKLNLRDSLLTGTIPPELGGLTSLVELNLGDNRLTGLIPSELSSLTNLEILSLTRNQLTGPIPPELSGLTGLETLALGGNRLTGPVPTWLDSLTNLQGLYLWGNQLTGPIPSELGSLTNLVGLDLRGNHLSGEIPSQLASLKNLQRLSLYDNQLTGTIPTWLGNLTNLERLYLSQNQLTGPIPSELGSLINLVGLDLRGNHLSGEIPSQLASLKNLQRLSLYDNQLTGTIPPELSGLTSLETLALGGNQLTGPVPTWLDSLTNLQGLYLWGNQLTGPVPSQLASLTNLQRLSLYDNQLSGPVPTWLGNLTNLERLYLSQNQLTGPIPSELGSLINLRKLWLHDNQLTGTIPTELGSLANLESLILCCNQLTGMIPAELGNLDNLEVLSLSGNELTGTIPAGLGSLANLEELFLSGNRLTGCVPDGLRDVADNDFNQLGLPFCAGASGAPTIGTLTPGADFLTITWAAPTGSPESAIIAYDLRYIETAVRGNSDADWTIVEDVWTTGSGALSYQIAGLTGGTQYHVQVRAVTAAGDGPWSAAVTGTTATWGAIRSFSPPSVAPAGEVVVMITASGYGEFGAVTETLPSGFSYVSSSLEDDSATVNGREVRFSLFGQTAFTYTVTASSTEGTYSFSGVLRNSDREDVPVGGALTIAVAAGDPLIVRYDANGNGMIEKSEVIAAINDYLFGEGDQAISKAEVIRLINLYLFG